MVKVLMIWTIDTEIIRLVTKVMLPWASDAKQLPGNARRIQQASNLHAIYNHSDDQGQVTSETGLT